MQGVEQSAYRKGALPVQHDWSKLERDDIYRQRIFGTESGAGDFIKVDEDKRLSFRDLIIYLIFTWSAWAWTWNHINVDITYQVNSAIRGSLRTVRYEINPVFKTFDDVSHMDDVRNWVMNAFPNFSIPTVQNFNQPISPVRFTVRRMSTKEHPNERFRPLVPQVWNDQSGIAVGESVDEDDDITPYGCYRVRYGDALRFQEEVPGAACSGGDLLTSSNYTDQGLSKEEVAAKCQQECELLDRNLRPCRCLTLKGTYECQFYYMPRALLNNSEGGILTPALITQGGSSAYAPHMREFEFSEGEGYDKSPGFVLTINTTGVPGMDKEILEWINGELLFENIAALSIDFLTYNPNYDVFTWIQIFFESRASGHVKATYNLDSLRITAEELADNTYQKYLWSVVDYLYVFMVISYGFSELRTLSQRKRKYWRSGWNWLTTVAICLHIIRLIVRSIHIGSSNFSKILVDMEENGELVPASANDFAGQSAAYQWLVVISAYTLFFQFLLLVRYLNEIVRPVRVLNDTLYQAMTPVVFLFIVVLDLFFAFMFWAHLMFGKESSAFQSVPQSFRSCTELLFGFTEAFNELPDLHPSAGIAFFVCYMALFFFILQNFGKAVILAAYADASAKHQKLAEEEKYRRKADAGKQNNCVLLGEDLRRHIEPYISARMGPGAHAESQEKLRALRKHNLPAALSFLVFLILYTVVTYFMMEIGTGNPFTQSIRGAIMETPFNKTHHILQEASFQNNFSTIETREDVMLFLEQVIPAVMYDSSPGTFNGRANPLKTYDSAPEFSQLVINSWNILLGQEPIRISATYYKTVELGPGNSIVGVSREGLRIPVIEGSNRYADGDSIYHDVIQATNLSDIVDPNVREVVSRYCSPYTFAYGATSVDEKNGWSCPLPINRTETTQILRDMREKRFIGPQNAALVIDFVVFNGRAEAFLYVAIKFGFHLSGKITKELEVNRIDLERWGGVGNVFRLLGEICILIFTIVYLALSVKGMFLAGRAHFRDVGEEGGCCKRAFRTAWAVLINHLVMGDFNLVDFLSIVLTIVMFVLWYSLEFTKLQDFFFPEIPIVGRGNCGSNFYCGDDEIAFYFAQYGGRARMFIRICAINIVLVWLRSVRYLLPFRHIYLVYSALASAAKIDMIWFIVAGSVFLFGFVSLGHHLFGATVEGFQTFQVGSLSCFQMFLGTFNYSLLPELLNGGASYVIFSVSYIFVFRYMLVNMFFAIVDKHYRLQEKEMQKARKEEEAREAELQKEGTEMPRKPPLIARTMEWFRHASGSNGGIPPSTPETAAGTSDIGQPVAAVSAILPVRRRRVGTNSTILERHQEEDDDDKSASSDDDDSGRGAGTPGTGSDNPRGTLMAGDMSLEELSNHMMENVPNWRDLPNEKDSGEIRDWAVKRSHHILTTYINEEYKNRQNADRDNDRPIDHEDKMLSHAEFVMQERRNRVHSEAVQVKADLEGQELSRLREVLQDQRSLEWYIMRREQELQKLKDKRTDKQDRFDKMWNAARSLISNDLPEDDDRGQAAGSKDRAALDDDRRNGSKQRGSTSSTRPSGSEDGDAKAEAR